MFLPSALLRPETAAVFENAIKLGLIKHQSILGFGHGKDFKINGNRSPGKNSLLGKRGVRIRLRICQVWNIVGDPLSSPLKRHLPH
ncbi:hypothetical protein BV898_11503 [Hypsibius exemplaris]|uniref:Uncharacterized protein n=1 Tax=Hypsibius exemplaris TaxID=2072580 RepID=A0A1W0WGD4_HYPEX|nr:hypothetical protein BV898_11503 [Hypsibius exemplaris]